LGWVQAIGSTFPSWISRPSQLLQWTLIMQPTTPHHPYDPPGQHSSLGLGLEPSRSWGRLGLGPGHWLDFPQLDQQALPAHPMIFIEALLQHSSEHQRCPYARHPMTCQRGLHTAHPCMQNSQCYLMLHINVLVHRLSTREIIRSFVFA